MSTPVESKDSLQATLGVVRVASEEQVLRLLARELRARARPRPSGAVVLTGIVDKTSTNRRMILLDDQLGRVVVYLSCTGVVRGHVLSTARVRVEGAVIDDAFAPIPDVEVLAQSVVVTRKAFDVPADRLAAR